MYHIQCIQYPSMLLSPTTHSLYFSLLNDEYCLEYSIFNHYSVYIPLNDTVIVNESHPLNPSIDTIDTEQYVKDQHIDMNVICIGHCFNKCSV